ncbi:alkaline phosphatase family protein [Polycladomyces subterraneus]|uniref:Alkaline phosphatase family protein n=1 Tax=Polycladomyces subterraneus TaxID=1016997 RepID=A0ABT8INQ2_9BACL|nr:alkaline phosphatase family protein [Polycladomyces subterraneus]MDN4594427.1 alkaline phosphatase family protein [Polycladomyces subterraneus]
MSKRVLLLLAMLMIFVIVVPSVIPKPAPSPELSSRPKRTVVVLLADSLTAHAIDEGIRLGRLPTLSRLIRHGQYKKDMVSVFPTMSVVIDQSLMTGTYPDQHRIPALQWYDPQEGRVINYGDTFAHVRQQGFLRTARWFLDYNRRHLNPRTQTIHEALLRKGYLSGSINMTAYRGPFLHPIPFTGQTTRGPAWFALGPYVSRTRPDGDETTTLSPTLYRNKDGLRLLSRWLRDPNHPDLMMVYLPDTDKAAHRLGPNRWTPVAKLDRELQKLIASLGSWDSVLRQHVFVLMGDSGVVAGKQDAKYLITLNKLASPYRLLPYGVSKRERNADVAIASNERMAVVHPLRAGVSLDRLIEKYRGIPGIDWVIIQKGRDILVWQGSRQLRFRSAGQWRDPYGQTWHLEGDPHVLDLQLDPQRHLVQFGRYPDALRLVKGGIGAQRGPCVMLTSLPGYEFEWGTSSLPNRGSHGGASRQELLVPIVVSDNSLPLPRMLRVVDLKQWLIRLVEVQHHPVSPR